MQRKTERIKTSILCFTREQAMNFFADRPEKSQSCHDIPVFAIVILFSYKFRVLPDKKTTESHYKREGKQSFRRISNQDKISDFDQAELVRKRGFRRN